MEALMRTAESSWSVASLTQAGERDSGDRCLVEDFSGGIIVAAIDALGHGPEAARAAELAVAALRDNHDVNPEAMLEQCHATLRGTRGAAISVAVLEKTRGQMNWIGIGNVCGALVRARTGRVEQLLVHAGVVGHKLPELRPSRIPVGPGDLLVLATDGIRGEFTEMLFASADPQLLAERLLEKYASRNDDALVLAFRCGESP
jgi:hypothetical protein